MGEFLPKVLLSKRLLLFALSTSESLLTLWYFASLPTTSWFGTQLCSRLPLPSTLTHVIIPSDMTLHRHASFVVLLCCLLMDSEVTFLASNTPSLSHLPAVTPSYFNILLGYPWLYFSLAFWELHSTSSPIFHYLPFPLALMADNQLRQFSALGHILSLSFHLSWEAAAIATENYTKAINVLILNPQR